MLRARVKPNEVTVLSLLVVSLELWSMVNGYTYMANNEIRINVHVGTALIYMYCKYGNLEDAIQDKDVVAWNSMIIG